MVARALALSVAFLVCAAGSDERQDGPGLVATRLKDLSVRTCSRCSGGPGATVGVDSERPPNANAQDARRRAVLEAAARLRDGARIDDSPLPDERVGSASCSAHSVFVDRAGVLLQTGGAGDAGPVASRPRAQCKCEEYACTCSKACGCKLTGDGGDKLVSKLHPRLTPEEIMGQGRPRGQKPSVVDYSFRCGCQFDVQQTVTEAGGDGSGGGEEGYGLATADGSLRCGCGKGSCECRRLCRCDTVADDKPGGASLLQASEGRLGAGAGWGGAARAPADGPSQPLDGGLRRRAAGRRGGADQAPLSAQRMRESAGEPAAPAEGRGPKEDAGWESGHGPGGSRGTRPAAPSELDVVLPFAGELQ